MKAVAAVIVINLALVVGAPSLAAQKRTIEAKDGDTVMMDSGSRVRVVRRYDGNVRAVYNASQHWLLLIVDAASPSGGPDGRVDASFSFYEVAGQWPLGERWEGAATIQEYGVVGDLGPTGALLVTPNGSVQLVRGRGAADFPAPPGVPTMAYGGGGRSSGGSTFDAAEQQQSASASRSVEMRAGAGLSATPSYPGQPQAPVRVGGNIRTPMKVEDAQPVIPDVARAAGLKGVVILEIIIGVDGRVSEAKVLRSVAELNDAALETVKKWRYEPTLLNGVPVPVIMTVTVNFP